MAEQLLQNTCFHEIDVAGIPDNTNITRIVSLINDKATMHTRLANADAFEPEIIDGARLFLITSYNEDKAVIDAATDIKAKTDERQDIKLEQTSDGDNKDTELNAAINQAMFEDPPRITTDIEIKFKNILGKDKLLEALNSNMNMEEIKALVADAEKAATAAAGGDDIPEAIGGKRTRRRKNHGSKRRNASNKSGRRASKQSRRRGKKQSKRHGRK